MIEQKANYTLTIEADSGYMSTTEGRCTAAQYRQAIAALHGEAPQRKPLPYEQLDSLWQTTDTGDFELDIREFARAIEAAHGIEE